MEALKWKMSYLENQLTGILCDEEMMIRQEIYEIKQLGSDGTLSKLEVDAKTGIVLKQKSKNFQN